MKQVDQYDLDGTYIQTFPSIKAAADSVYGNHSLITRVCVGNAKTAYGYKWRYCPKPSEDRCVIHGLALPDGCWACPFNDQYRCRARGLRRLDTVESRQIWCPLGID